MIRFYILVRSDHSEGGASQLVYCRESRYAEGFWLPRLFTPTLKWLKFNSHERADFIREQLQQKAGDVVRVIELTEREIDGRPDQDDAA